VVIQVSGALVRYYKNMADKRDVVTKKHWDDLSFHTIQSNYLQQTFKDAFEAYTAGQTINIPWYRQTDRQTDRDTIITQLLFSNKNRHLL
jgi:hypothetical protein